MQEGACFKQVSRPLWSLRFLQPQPLAHLPSATKGSQCICSQRQLRKFPLKKWGLVYDPSQEALQTPDEFLSLVRRQPRAVQDNGVWIVVTDPDVYGEQEKELLTDVETLCRKEKIVLFVARAADLPHGWKRVE